MKHNKRIYSAILNRIKNINNVELLFCICCLLFTLLGFGAAELYVTNNSEFWFEYHSILPMIILYGIVLLAVIYSGIIFSSRGKVDLYIAIIVGLNIAFYIQGNYLPNDYGSLNGESINWAQYSNRGFICTIIWLLIIIGCILFYKIKKHQAIRILTYISTFILAMQVVSLAIIMIMYYDRNEDAVNKNLTREGIYTVSDTDNTIVLLLDCFDAAVMDKLIEDYPSEVASCFEDFTYYRNTVGGATRTKYAIPYIMTGEINKKEQSYTEYIIDSYNNSPLFQELNKEEIDSRIYSEVDFVDMRQDKAIDNLSDKAKEINSKPRLALKYIQLVMYKYLPQILKKYAWMYSGDFDKYKSDDGYYLDDVKFYNNMLDNGIKTVNKKKAFRFYHLQGDHPPYTMNEDCERVNENESDEIRQALGSIRIVREYLKQIRELGVYEEASIVVMSDHGSNRGVEQHPIFLVKDSFDKHEFSISEIKLSYSTFCDYIADRLKDNTTKVSDYVVDGIRLFYFAGGNSGVVNITEWATDGDAWDLDKYYMTGNVYHGDSLNRKYAYELGTDLYFTTEATADYYEIEGFSQNEGTHTWTSGNKACMYFEIQDDITNDLILELDYSIFGDTQDVIIEANDQEVEDYQAVGREHKEIIIPAEYITDGKLTITFNLPTAHGTDLDSRQMALAMTKMKIRVNEE